MQEVEEVSRKLGMELPVSIDQRIAGAEKVGEHKTSMLQDLEAGRPMELEALVGAVVELGERVGLSMTCTRTVYNCTKLLAECAVRQQAQMSGLVPIMATPLPTKIFAGGLTTGVYFLWFWSTYRTTYYAGTRSNPTSK